MFSMNPVLERLSERWWAIALRGVVAILFGVVAWVWPALTITTLVLLFGAFAVAAGILTIVAAFDQRKRGNGFWPLLVVGIIDILAGLVAMIWPGVSALALMIIIGSWAIASGIFEIVAAIKLRKLIDGEWWMALGGVASILFGLVALIFPGSGAIALVWLIGIYAITFGILFIALGFRLRSLKQGQEHRSTQRADHLTDPVGA